MVTTKNNHLFYSKALILASGSYQSNPLMRKKYLGEAWEDIQLRGVVYNTGDAIKIAIEKSIKLFGDFNHCHSTPQCSNLSQLYPGDNDLSQSNSRYCFQLGITVNKMGMRFFNEHEDLPNFIYAKFGAAIIQQPEKIAFQIFDSESIKKLPHGYFSTKNFYRSQTIEGLAKAFNISSENILKSVYDYNLNLDINLNNWTHFTDINRPLPILKAPFYLAPVRAGLTYCYGGLKINSSSNIFTSDDLVIPNIFAVGELAGGLHYQNYAGGTGMMFGSHFGRIAGLNASKIK
jgi:tricarballylate dehydrogenase